MRRYRVAPLRLVTFDHLALTGDKFTTPFEMFLGEFTPLLKRELMPRQDHWRLEVKQSQVFHIGRFYARYFFAFSPNLDGVTIDNGFGVLQGRGVIGKIEANRGSRNGTIVFENKETIDSHGVPARQTHKPQGNIPGHLSPGKYAFALDAEL